MKKYPGLLLIFIVFVIALFLSPFLGLILNYFIHNFGIYSAVVIGFFYTFAFTSGVSAVMISNLEENFLVFSLLSATGAMLADLTIMHLLKTNLKKEIDQILQVINFHKILLVMPALKNKIVQLVLGFLVVGSPLPDELGLLILHDNKILNKTQFYAMCFISNFIFIYLISSYL